MSSLLTGILQPHADVQSFDRHFASTGEANPDQIVVFGRNAAGAQALMCLDAESPIAAGTSIRAMRVRVRERNRCAVAVGAWTRIADM